MIRDDDPLYQAAIKAIKEVYQQAVQRRHCKNCGYMAQGWARGDEKDLCSHPYSDFFELDEFSNPAQNCEFFERR